jgi:hypothetical protein
LAAILLVVLAFVFVILVVGQANSKFGVKEAHVAEV